LSFSLFLQSQQGPGFLDWKPGRISQYLLSSVAILFVAAVCFLFSAHIGSEVVAFILLLTLSALAMVLDILPVLLAAVLSALIWDYFFLVPRYNLRVGNTEDKIMLSMYFVIAMINAALTFKIRQIEKAAGDKEQKAQTNKLYNTILNSLCHEFRTPIATIIGATDNLLENPAKLSGNDKNDLLAEISIASLRLNHHVENLLNMSRVESGFIELKKDWCDPGELIYASIQKLSEELREHQVSVRIENNLPLFKLDYGLMENVLYNLLNNAAQYTPVKSNIYIVAMRVEGNLVIEVEDNGRGFPPDEMQKAFQKFYRLDQSKTGGTGLGLSIARGFVEAHEGTIELTTGACGGAKFIIVIPPEKIFA